MKVKELMSTNIACVGENASPDVIALQMKKNNIGSLPVCDDAGHIKGIVTDRDLVLRVMARYATADSNEPPAPLTAKDIMTKNPITISADQSIHNAALLFSAHKIRRLPVTEASRVIGMLSLGDIAVKPVHIDEAGDALSAISMADGLQAKS